MDDVQEITVKTLPVKPRLNESHRFKVCFPNFENLPSEEEEVVKSPAFVCFGRRWKLLLYPGGHEDAENGMVSIYVQLCSGCEIEIDYDVRMKNGDGNIATDEFEDELDYCGWSNYKPRSEIIRELNDNRELVVVVCMRLVGERSHFILPNPILGTIRKAFNDRTTSDVLFLVGGLDTDKEGKTPVQYHAHRLVLKESAPFLFALCANINDKQPVSILGVDPIIFGFLFKYLYGDTIPVEQLKENAKEIIEVSNKYCVTGLKILAETCHVESTVINIDNAVDNLLYAKAKDCALLNEAVMDFIVKNGAEVLENISFDHISGNVVSDLLAAVERTLRAIANSETERNDEGTNDYHGMRISTLRQMCHEKGLEVDGPRKALIDSLKKAQDSDE